MECQFMIAARSAGGLIGSGGGVIKLCSANKKNRKQAVQAREACTALPRPRTSLGSVLYLHCISRLSPLHLPCISPSPRPCTLGDTIVSSLRCAPCTLIVQAGFFHELNGCMRKFIDEANKEEAKKESEKLLLFRRRLLVMYVKGLQAVTAVGKKAEGEGHLSEANKCVHMLASTVKLVMKLAVDPVHRITRNHEENTMKLLRAGGEQEWLCPKSNVIPPPPGYAIRPERQGSSIK